jgi:vanillate monooxygenase ferredoxin subunit
MIEVTVSRKTREASGIFGFELLSVDGRELPPFTAGAHIDVRLPNGLTRQYSLYNQPDEANRYCIAVLNAPVSRGGSRYLTEAVQEGDRLLIGSPRNLFPLDENASFSLLVAGGIGITPILAMAFRLHRCQQDFRIHYCGRTSDAMAFQDLLRSSPFAEKLMIHTDDGPREQAFDPEHALGSAPPESHLYVCGPNGFMENLLGVGRRLGWPQERLHCESFAAGNAALPVNEEDFVLRLARTGRDLIVPAGKSVAATLIENGIDVSLSCEQGMCGTCMLSVVEGEPEHRDTYLSDAERARNDVFMACCSRSRTPVLTIDL